MRSLRLTSFLTFFALTTGCYTLQPVAGAAPPVGTQVAFDVNDAGRYALGGSMGPEIIQIQGRLLERSSADYLLSVSSVRLMRGGVQVWKGEQIRVNLAHIGSPYIRKFSKGRTAVLGAAVLGGFAAFMVSRGLIVGGRAGGGPGDTTIVDAIIIRP